jgi:Polysaccharide pyruvyl transferase
MIRKLTKVKRYWSARLGPKNAPAMFWHVGRPNFGDDINPSFYEALCGLRPRLVTRREARHFLGMGSILEKATETSLVLGSGFLKPPVNLPKPAQIISLRGALSRDALGLDDSVILGDPMVLVDQLLSPDSGGDTGFVPHVLSLKWARLITPPEIRLIDVGRDPWAVVRDISSCRRVICQSLHALIVADALEIPNLWVAPSDKMMGGRYKFDDYFSTLDAPKTMHSLTPQLLRSLPDSEFSVGQYKWDKVEYRRVLKASLTECL